MKIAFLCDGYGCESQGCKKGGPCRRTVNIEHAKNFEKLTDSTYIERETLGEWIQKEDSDYGGDGYSMCSVCLWKFSFAAYPLIHEHRFCPHCGMRMQSQWEDDADD